MSEQEQQSPPLRVPVPRQRTLTRADIAGQMEDIIGRRAILARSDRTFRDYRVWGEVQVRARGFQGVGTGVRRYPYVPVVSERAYWSWRLLGQQPTVLWWPAGAVWVEDDGEPAA